MPIQEESHMLANLKANVYYTPFAVGKALSTSVQRGYVQAVQYILNSTLRLDQSGRDEAFKQALFIPRTLSLGEWTNLTQPNPVYQYRNAILKLFMDASTKPSAFYIQLALKQNPGDVQLKNIMEASAPLEASASPAASIPTMGVSRPVESPMPTPEAVPMMSAAASTPADVSSLPVASPGAGTLVLGCCPWDDNIQMLGLDWICHAEFIDLHPEFYNPPPILPENFHQLDFLSPSLQRFSSDNPNTFREIIIDWQSFKGTYSHMPEFFSYIYNLLKEGGSFSMPIFSGAQPDHKIWDAEPRNLAMRTKADQRIQDKISRTTELLHQAGFNVQVASPTNLASISIPPLLLRNGHFFADGDSPRYGSSRYRILVASKPFSGSAAAAAASGP